MSYGQRRREFLKGMVAAGVGVAVGGRLGEAEASSSGKKLDFDDVIKAHPAGEQLSRLFGGGGMKAEGFRATGMGRRDYLPLIAGEVDFWKGHQNSPGAIIDPYEKKERQYSTPAFALAGALLVGKAGRTDLIDAAGRALTFSIAALVNHTTADLHADFYIPMVVHARRLLMAKVPKETADRWTKGLISLVPEKTYRDTTPHANWNIVNVSGECLRRKDGLVDPSQADAQMAYIERCLAAQQARMTKFGMYEDPNSPLAYDAFPRLWLEDMTADGAYDGKLREKLENWLVLGGLSTLLVLSPSGEWACGGRSAQHQWNEAEVAVICENNANRWKAAGREDIAGVFKRAAHLALTSMQRWVRPDGAMWIVKNRADPEKRHGYEGYSFFSQYNLLPMGMLALAYLHADDSIVERPAPAEAGSYVFDLRDTFHKVIAAAGGTYVEIETGTDPHYNATGLLRVHRAGVPLSACTENTTEDRAYGPKDGGKASITPGVAWKRAGRWESLADFVNEKHVAKSDPRAVKSADLESRETADGRVRFAITYRLGAEGGVDRTLSEEFAIDHSGVEVTSRTDGASRVVFPVLVSDGEKNLKVVALSRVAVERGGRFTVWEVALPAGVRMGLEGPRVASHNGWVQAAVGELPEGTREVRWRVSFEGV